MKKSAPDDDWIANTGSRPGRTKDKRVRVILERDRQAMVEPIYDNSWNPMSPPGWAADTTRWTIKGEPFDVAFYQVIGR